MKTELLIILTAAAIIGMLVGHEIARRQQSARISARLRQIRRQARQAERQAERRQAKPPIFIDNNPRLAPFEDYLNERRNEP